MKKIAIFCLTLLCALLTACQSGEQAENPPEDTVQAFFAAFETADYQSMQNYCTEDCVDTYFHDGDVFGMVWAKAENIQKQTIEDKEGFLVDVQMETAPTSALYSETETSFYVWLTQNASGDWLVDSFTTG